MSRARNESQKSFPEGLSTGLQADEHGHAPGPLSLLSAEAPAFVPGTPAVKPTATPLANRRPEAAASPSQGGRHSWRGRKGSAGGEGGLSKALSSSNSRNVNASPATQSPISTAAAAGPAEASPLGRSPSTRGYQSANHLLNFHLASPAQQGRLGHDARGPRLVQRSQPFNRSQFLQINFRFLVSDAADLRQHAVNADLMLDWDDVVEVEMPVTAQVQCPISLESPPQCPQITPCGHVFGFAPMMAHLLSHGGPSLRKASPCPLCFTPVAARELRLVRTQLIQPPQAGSCVEFQLLRRHHGSSVPVPVGDEGDAKGLTTSPGLGRGGWPTVSADAVADLCGERKLKGTGSVAYDRHSKFTLIGKPLPLWQHTVQQLAHAAVQVIAEGGVDAAVEVPALYAAIDAVKARAAAWEERRQNQLAQASAGVNPGTTQPEEAGATVARLVQQAAEQAAEAANLQQQRAETDAVREQEFPALHQSSRLLPGPAFQQQATPSLAEHQPASQASTAEPPAAAMSSKTAAKYHWAASVERNLQAAFSDDDCSPREDAAEAFTQPDVEGLDASSPVPAHHDFTGSSPPSSMPTQPANEFLFYQAADGQWVYVSPLDLRILAAAYGSLPDCPRNLTVPLASLDRITQTEATRRRFKHLAHLPLTGTFTVAELDLSQVVGKQVLQPFAKELAGRQRRHDRRAAEQAERSRKEAAYEADLASAHAAPDAAELRAMPRPGGGQDRASQDAELAAALERSLAEEAMVASGCSPPLPQHGVSFASMTKMGFAASGPSLPATRQSKLQSPPVQTRTAAPLPADPPPARGPWGAASVRQELASPQGDQQSSAPPPAAPSGPQPNVKKGRKQMVLLSTMQRRY